MKEFVIIEEKGFEKARKKIQESAKSGETTVFSSKDDDLNRKVLEKEKIDVLLINVSGRKDRQKQRDSGFNQVLAKIAKKNKVAIGINFDEIVNSKNLKEKDEILARIKQNIKLCKKNDLNMKFISPSGNERNIYDLKSLGLVLGMTTGMVKRL